jgi:hypothetical protein
MPPRFVLPVVYLVLATLVGACQSPIVSIPPTPVPAILPTATATPSPSPIASPAVLLYDDFEDGRQNRWPWGGGVSLGGVRGYADGGYRISVRRAEWIIWSFPRHSESYGDTSIEVDARATADSAVGEYGVACRTQAETWDAYIFFVSTDGFARIVLVVDHVDELEFVDIGDEVYDEAILTDGAVNHIRVDCIGDHLTLYVNDHMVIEAWDDSWAEGHVGLLVNTWEESPLTAWFDNVRVSEPLPRPRDDDDLAHALSLESH